MINILFLPPQRLIIVLILLLFVGCSSNRQSYHAPVYSHDLINKLGYYQVKQGDTLYSIGIRSGLGYHRLAKWNKIFPPYRLKIGQKIKLFKPKQKLRHQNNHLKKSTKSPRNSQKSLTISKVNKKMLKLYWQWPIQGKVLKSFKQTDKKGIDIGAKVGQKVHAASHGKVVYSGSGLKGYDNLVIIKHNNLFLSAYANNRRLLVKEGQTIKKGQLIAEVGRLEGKPTALHFEIRKNGQPVNPIHFLPKK